MLNITRTQRQNFKRHYISNAFVEVRFDQRHLDWIAIEQTFKQVAADKLNLNISRRTITTELKLNPSDKESQQQISFDSNTQIIGLVAQNKDNTFSIQVQSDRMIFSTQKYPGFNNFWTEVENGIAILAPIFRVDKYNWAGVRKINEILATNDNGIGYTGEGLNIQLVGPIASGVFKSNALLSGASRYELSENNKRCIIGTEISRINEKDYLLKLDLDMNENFNNSSLESVKQIATALNDDLFDVFIWAASDELIKSLGSN